MSNRLPEIAQTLGALDSTAIADGTAAHAHVLRETARNANRLRGKRHPLLVAAWDIDTTGSETDGGLYWIAPPVWVMAMPGPIPIPKKPDLVRADVRIRATVTSGATVYFQIETSEHVFAPHAQSGDANVVTCVGTGSLATYAIDVADGLRTSARHLDTLRIWVRGDPTATALDTATYGSPASGTLNGASDYVFPRELSDNSATWNSSSSGSAHMDQGGYGVYFKDGAGNTVVSHRVITDVPATNRLSFWPPLTVNETRAAYGRGYVIVQLPQARVAGISVYAADRGQVTP